MSLRTIIIVSALVLVALVSCDENADRIYDPNSPYGILMGLVNYFNNHEDEDNIKRVNNALSSNFIFYFDHDDVGTYVGDYVIPVSWTKTEMMSAVRNMFNQAYSIELQIPILDDGEGAFGKPNEGDTSFSKNDISINLLVMVDATNGYIVDDLCNFEFHKDETSKWNVAIWWDRYSFNLLANPPPSLGLLLAFYY